MRTFLTLLAALCWLTTVPAQSSNDKALRQHQKKVAESAKKGNAVLSMDTIFYQGAPYALLKKSTKTLMPIHTLQALDGTDLSLIQWTCQDNNQACFYDFQFLASGQRARVDDPSVLRIEKVIVAYDLVKDGAINPVGEAKLTLQFPQLDPAPAPPAVIQIVVDKGKREKPKYATVERNRQAMIVVFSREIRQDTKVIGTYATKSVPADGGLLEVITISLPDGTRVAEATRQDMFSGHYRVVTLKDNAVHGVHSTKTGEVVRDIAQFLSDRYYL